MNPNNVDRAFFYLGVLAVVTLAGVVVFLALAKPKSDHGQGPGFAGPPTRDPYHYVVKVTPDAYGVCQSTVTGGPNTDPNWIDLSVSNNDTVKWDLPAATPPYSVNFPKNQGNYQLPGTPFLPSGVPTSAVPGGTVSPTASFTNLEDSFFYFQISTVLKPDGKTPYCSSPIQGMGVHVTQ